MAGRGTAVVAEVGWANGVAAIRSLGRQGLRVIAVDNKTYALNEAYDPKTDRFLFTRPPKGTADRREIAISLGWAQRLAAAVRDKKTRR